MLQIVSVRRGGVVLLRISLFPDCGWYGNKGAIMVIEESGESQFKQFSEVDNVPYVIIHPFPSRCCPHLIPFMSCFSFVLPKNLNAFSYSLPILAEKITHLLHNFFHLSLDEETEATLTTLTASRTQLRQRILSLNQIHQTLQLTNEKTQLLIKLKGLVGDLPQEANQMSVQNLNTRTYQPQFAICPINLF